MSIRSHVDPCLFVVFLHVQRDHIDDDLEAVVRSFQLRNGESVEPVLGQLSPRSQQIQFHENYHFWQGLRLPFLFRYVFVSLFQVASVFRSLARNNPNYREWSLAVPSFHRLELPFRVGFAPGGHLYCGGHECDLPAHAVERIVITPLLLLECAASLAEFQGMNRGPKCVDPVVFRRWAKRNPAYLVPFDFAAKFLGSEALALRALLPLINAAFHTSLPERAFVDLLARLWGNFALDSEAGRVFLAQQEPCRWRDVFERWLGQLDYDAEPDVDAEPASQHYFRLTLQHWVGASIRHPTGIEMTHPILGPLARRWVADEQTRPQLSWFLDQPGWISDETIEYCARQYLPPATLARFHFGDGNDRVFWFGKADLRDCTNFPEWSDKGFLLDYMTMHGAVRRASGAFFDGSQRVCYHTSCPHHAPGFCNVYPSVPEVFGNCGFPRRIEELITLGRQPDAQPNS